MEHRKKEILLECNFCDKHFKKTDKLYLKTVKHRDYLLCEKHFIKWGGKPNEKSNSSRIV